MSSRISLRLFGGIGLVAAAFALVAGIVVAPIVEWAWTPKVVVTKHGASRTEPAQLPADLPITTAAKPRQG